MDLQEVKKPKLYSMAEVAAFMEVGYFVLYRMVKSGRIKALNIAKTGKKPIYAFDADGVQAYYDSLSTSHRELEAVHK